MYYEFRLNECGGTWHLMRHDSPRGLFSVCGHSRACYQNVAQRVVLDKATMLVAANTLILPRAYGITDGKLCCHCARLIGDMSRSSSWSSWCAPVAIEIESEVEEPIMLDQTKPIIICSDGTQYQADTVAAATQLAKQLIAEGGFRMATIFTPHTKLERQSPPIKATRIKSD